mmetsp:Transcript_11223/g.22359  ORF Transcript_11223/g.22359 Transcript_11223/m.22359 type:complete len:148 (+) Transcript_11223:6892-7335(+)
MELGEAADYGNHAEVETTWAAIAYAFAERHWACLEGLPADAIKLTRDDAAIYSAFRDAFPDFSVDVVDEETMKNPAGKAQWRTFLESDHLREWLGADYNFGTLLRIDSAREYSPENTILVVRGQFYAIEIARNSEGLNQWLPSGSQC